MAKSRILKQFKMKKMKKLSILLYLLATVVLAGCNDLHLPSADYNRAQIKNLQAVAGDEQVTLSWEPYDNFSPEAYRLSWGDADEVTITDTHYTVKGLENDQKYTFNIQAIYDGNVKSGQVSVSCTPVTSRIAVANMTAEAENTAIVLSWEKPADNVTGYTIACSLKEEEVKTVEVLADETTVTIDGLTNYKNYTFTFVAHYPNGDSKPSVVKGMPATGPLYKVSTTTPGLGAEVSYELDAQVEATQTVWQFDDGASASDTKATHRYLTSGAHVTKLNVTLVDGSDISVDIELNVRDTYFCTDDFDVKSGDYNGFKGQCPVFSPDGKTVYAVTFRAPAGVYAYDIATSTRKWGFTGSASSAAYGCAPIVDPNSGVVYYGTSVAGEFYAVNPDGTLKWKCTQMKALNKSYPAIGSDGTIYVLDSSSKMFAISASDGSVKWSVTLSGANGGVLVNESGTTRTGDGAAEIIVGTKTNIFFLTTGGQIKESETIESNAMTEITGFAVSPNKKTIYYGTKGNGVYSVDLATHEQKNFLDPAMTNDIYCPAVAPDGTVVCGMKTASNDAVEAVFGINPDMTKKWSFTIGLKNAFNYCHPAIDAQGYVYIGANDGTLYQLDANGKVVTSWGVATSSGFMSAVNICDKAVFGGTIGSKTVYGKLFGAYIGANRAASWSSRGGDICGTSCLK